MSNRFNTAVRRSAMVCMVAALGLAGSAPATLLDRGPDLVYDDALNITWTRNANLPGSSHLTWADANTWAANLVFAGFDDWRLPYASVSVGAGPTTTVVDCATASEHACRDNEMGYMFYHDLGGSTGDNMTVPQGNEVVTAIQVFYWSGTKSNPGVWNFIFDGGIQDGVFEGGTFSAWAVRAGDVAAVPEPATLLLIGVGMLGLEWHGRRRRRALDLGG